MTPQPNFKIESKQIQKETKETKETKKSSELHNQMDKLMSKLEQMDQTINHLSKSFQQSRMVDRDSTFANTPPRQRQIQYPQIQESQVQENLTSSQMEKGIRFEDKIYFGELNERHERHGYGTLYDSQGRIIYCGYWYKNKYHNRGKVFFYDLRATNVNGQCFENQQRVDQNKVSYTGQFWYGDISGLGQMKFQQKSGNQKFIYYGRFEKGIFQGRGTLAIYNEDLDEDADGFQGVWKQGVYQGGKMLSPQRKY